MLVLIGANMTYGISVINKKSNRTIDYDNVKIIELFERGVAITCNDGFKTIYEAHEFTDINIYKEINPHATI